MMVVKGASRCRFEKITGKCSAGQKKLNKSLASETRPQGFVPFRLRIFLSGAKTKKHITRMNRECFFLDHSLLWCHRQKGCMGWEEWKMSKIFCGTFLGDKNSPFQKKKKCAKVLGSYNDTYGLMTYFEKRNPWQNHPFLWYVSGKLVICHSYVSLQEWLFRKKKKPAIKQHWQLSPLGMSSPRSGRILKKPGKIGPAEEESIIFWRL